MRDAVDAEFDTFLSLSSFIPHGSLGEFLADVSGHNGNGYARWRYVLVEYESGPPRNSPDAMLAAWRCLLLELSRQSEWNADVGPLHEEIEAELLRFLDEAGAETGHGSHPDIASEVQGWFRSGPNRLSAFALVLDRYRNYGRHGITSASAPFSALLTHWYRGVVARTENDNTETSMFARHAWGDLASAGTGPSIVWNDEERLIRPTPWTLEFRSSSAAPEDGVVVAHVQRFSGRLVVLRRLTADCSYRFLKNRSFPATVPNTHWCVSMKSMNRRWSTRQS